MRNYGVVADDDLDHLYSVRPEVFTAERTKLAAAAKKRGDTAAARRISAARKPTTAAWIVNRLALSRRDTAQRLGDLGDRLRAAHAALDGERIRELSAEQHRLVDTLTRAAFEAAREAGETKPPSSSVRDDVTGTLQAAVADPDVHARLGHLARPEQWSGFGAFADAPAASKPSGDSAARRRQQLKAAERAQTEAEEALSARRAERDAAAHRREDARAALRVAERELDAAQGRCAEAERASRAAAEAVEEAKAQLRRG